MFGRATIMLGIGPHSSSSQCVHYTTTKVSNTHNMRYMRRYTAHVLQRQCVNDPCQHVLLTAIVSMYMLCVLHQTVQWLADQDLGLMLLSTQIRSYRAFKVIDYFEVKLYYTNLLFTTKWQHKKNRDRRSTMKHTHKFQRRQVLTTVFEN